MKRFFCIFIFLFAVLLPLFVYAGDVQENFSLTAWIIENLALFTALALLILKISAALYCALTNTPAADAEKWVKLVYSFIEKIAGIWGKAKDPGGRYPS